MWVKGSLPVYGFAGRIRPELAAECGRALCSWGDPIRGESVKRGKFVIGRFDDGLVEASAELIIDRWHPDPFPDWLTCIPSLTRPSLVPNFAQRLAVALKIKFIPAIVKTRQTKPQKEMENSFHRSANLDGAFSIKKWEGMNGAVLLVDDMVDSGWTFTILSALLRKEGSGSVYPFALADASGAE